MRIVYKAYVRVFCTLRISRSSAGSMSRIHVSTRSTSSDSCLSIFVSQAPLQDPCLWIHISAAVCISGSSTRSTSSDSCLSIFVFQEPLQDPCLRIHVSASLYLRILCKIHVSGSMGPIHVLASTKKNPLQDPCLRIHVSASLYLRILYKIHVLGFMSQHPPIWMPCKIHVSGLMSQHLCISGSSTRSMSSDSCLSIHMYLRNLCKIHVSGSIHQHPFVSQDPLQDPCVRFISQHLYISGSSARSMSPDSCRSISLS